MESGKKPNCFFGNTLIGIIIICLFSACVHKTVPQKTPEPNVDMVLVQEFYNIGLQYYADENYLEAKKAWQQVVRMAPNTKLASKSREYLKKVDKILKTLRELEQKQK